MKTSYNLKKNISFTLILIAGFNYVVFLFIAVVKVLTGVLMLMVIILSYMKDGQNDSVIELLKTPIIYIHLAGLMLLVYLINRVGKAIISEFGRINKTNRLIKSFEVRHTDEFNVINHKAKYAFTFGLFHPKVYISKGVKKTFTKSEFDSIVLHENAHAYSKDPMRQLIIRFIKNATPSLPFKSFVFDSYDVLTELSADEFAFKNINSKKPLLSSLLKFSDYDDKFEFSLSHFSMSNSRILILIEEKQFLTYLYFSFISILIIATFLNALILYKANIFIDCNHLVECFQMLFGINTHDHAMMTEICQSHTYGFFSQCANLSQ
jgi:hypothetical protein